MTIPEKMIMDHVNMLLTGSEPGAELHHLHVVDAPRNAIGPLGLPAEDQLQATIYAIVAGEPPRVGYETPERLVARVVVTAGVEAAREKRVPLFAAMSHEVWGVTTMDEKAAQLHRAGRLQEHPDAAEMTLVYAACRDGRRWRGRRWLTGPDAGKTEYVDLLVGRPDPREAFGMPAAHLLRRLVSLPSEALS